MYDQTDVMTIERLYKQRSIGTVIASDKDVTTTHGKLLNSNDYFNEAKRRNDPKTDVNDTLIGCCEDFFKYCCLCTVRKRKSVASISPVTNHIKYVIESDPRVTGVPIIKFERTTVQRDVVE